MYIRKNSDLTVQHIIGEMDVDSWPKDRWYKFFNANNVLVMSCQIFLDVLTRGYIKPRQVNLLVFDECHHATKNHPYVQIMRVLTDFPQEDRPRILGLSASLLAKKVKPGELEKGVKALESTLMSTAKTSQDLQEVAKYATQPMESVSYYKPSTDDATTELRAILTPSVNFLKQKIAMRQTGKLAVIAKEVVTDLYDILIELGSETAAVYVDQALDTMKRALDMANMKEDEWDYNTGCLVMTNLTLFQSTCHKRAKTLSCSGKVTALLNILADNAVKSGESGAIGTLPLSSQSEVKKSEKLRGIIFVEKTKTASGLALYLKKKSKEDDDLRHISCDFVIGHGSGQGMKSRRQDEVLNKFRRGYTNLLVATNVIEEGVDVPKCNLVIRFSLPQTFRSYIQSKGRARDKPSMFILMVGGGTSNADLDNYKRLEGELVRLCQEERYVPSEEEVQSATEELIDPYMPNGLTGARVTLGSSLQLLHRYTILLLSPSLLLTLKLQILVGTYFRVFEIIWISAINLLSKSHNFSLGFLLGGKF